MIIELPFLGKTKNSFIEQGILKYSSRLKHYTSIHISTLKTKYKKGLKAEQIRLEEGRILLTSLPPVCMKVVLDAKGKQLDSEGFAKHISSWEQKGCKHIAFLIGGPTGHSSEVLEKADFLLSLSAMTFTHDMVRLFLLEQLYRAYTIKAGEKYHK